MRLLVVDNYDSFTFNLVALAVRVTGEMPKVVRNDALRWIDVLALDPDAIVLSPGPGHPERGRDVGVCLDIVRYATVPVLGICLGHQALAHAFGGAVIRLPEPFHGRTSRIVLEPDAPLFEGIPSGFEAVRYHSLQVADPSPSCLRVTARSDDGVVMALAHRERALFGVQFHPESIASQHGEALLANFLARAGSSRPASSWGAPVDAAPPERAPPASYRLLARTVDLRVDPDALFEHLHAADAAAVWLDGGGDARARFSVMGAAGPHGFVVRYDAARGTTRRTYGDTSFEESASLDDVLSRELARHRPASFPDLPCGFAGGFLGYWGYEMRAATTPPSRHRSPHPDAQFVFADRSVVLDHVEEKVHLLALVPDDAGDVASAERWFDTTAAALGSLGPRVAPRASVIPAELAVRWDRSRESYLATIARALEAIRAGESYEVCLTNMARVTTRVDPRDFHRELRASSPAPYAAYARFGELHVVCASPERFLAVDPQGRVETKPIKGTAPRSANPLEDRRLAEALRTSEKTRSENLMVADLLRNDLATVCRPETVRVPRLMEVESFATVHQLVTTCEGRLRPGVSAVDCLRACSPGGSMTGAPKLRTLEILDALEPRARGVYAGSLGYLSLNGAADFNIVIRTAVFAGGEASIGVGGAVVALSDPESEYEETLLKARALLDALAVCEARRASGAVIVETDYQLH